MDIQTLAEETRKLFVRKKRDNGKEFWSIPLEKKEEWIKIMIREAHNGMMPDDYKYEFIVEALDRLAEGYDPDGDEIEADCYNSELSDWLGSHCDRAGYVDDAVKNYGHSDDGIYCDMMMGQVEEKREVFFSVKQSLENRIEDMEIADDAKDIMQMVKEEKEKH